MCKYLFISPHTDDVELSCGGFISKMHGVDTKVISLSRIYQHPKLKMVDTYNEFFNSMNTLDVDNYEIFNFTTREFYKEQDEILQLLFNYHDYDFIIAPDPTDFHSDHSVIGHCAARAFKNKNLLTYKATWNGRDHKYNYFIKLEKSHIESKIEALSCYESQKFRPYMNPDYIWANARNMGIMAGCEFAEAFQVVNLIN